MQHYASALLFDNDGVLSDSIESVDASWGQWADIYAPGFALGYEHHGIRAEELVAANVSAELYEEALKKIIELEIAMTYLTKPMPGAIEITTALPAGVWTIVTSALPELAQARLNKAGIPIPKELVTSSDVSRGKPDPEPYLVGARKLGKDIKECVVFEDAPNGILSGKRAGAGLVVGVGVEAMNSEADLVIKNLEGISFDGKLLNINSEYRLR
jgi:mannitol-1-/sugar-/sorbitol-6-phosphatase